MNKHNTIKNIKIFGHSIKRIAPYVLVASIAFEAFSLNGATPFIKDTSYSYAKYIKEWDSKGNITTIQDGNVYSKDPIDNSVSNTNVYYYTKWKKNEDGTYQRSKYSYKLNSKNLTDSFLEEILSTKDYSKLNEILQYTSDINEYADSLSEEVLDNNKDYVVVNTTSTEKEIAFKYIQNTYDNCCDSAIYLTTIITAFALIGYIRKRNGYSYNDIIKDIKEKPNDEEVKYKVELLEEQLKKEKKIK